MSGSARPSRSLRNNAHGLNHAGDRPMVQEKSISHEGAGTHAEGSNNVIQQQQQTHKAKQQEQLKLLQSHLINDFAGATRKDDGAFMSTVVKSVSTVLDGESIISTPAAGRVPWLGTISVTPGQVKGSVVKPFRTYIVESQVLAADHVLPWKISTVWRYSQLRSLLVDRLRGELFMHGLEEDFDGFVDTFPQKSWSGRLSDSTAATRATEIQAFVARGLELVSQLMETCGDEQNENVDDDENEDDDEEEDEEMYRIKRRRRRPKGLRVVLDLFTRDLLHLRPSIYTQMSELSATLGVIIASAPKNHCLLDKDFYVNPQQGL